MNKKSKISFVVALFLVAIISVPVVFAPPAKKCNNGIDDDGESLLFTRDVGGFLAAQIHSMAAFPGAPITQLTTQNPRNFDARH